MLKERIQINTTHNTAYQMKKLLSSAITHACLAIAMRHRTLELTRGMDKSPLQMQEKSLLSDSELRSNLIIDRSNDQLHNLFGFHVPYQVAHLL